jgi:hypothetical protein
MYVHLQTGSDLLKYSFYIYRAMLASLSRVYVGDRGLWEHTNRETKLTSTLVSIDPEFRFSIGVFPKSSITPGHRNNNLASPTNRRPEA